jgi:hypothetical protein
MSSVFSKRPCPQNKVESNQWSRKHLILTFSLHILIYTAYTHKHTHVHIKNTQINTMHMWMKKLLWLSTCHILIYVELVNYILKNWKINQTFLPCSKVCFHTTEVQDTIRAYAIYVSMLHFQYLNHISNYLTCCSFIYPIILLWLIL